MSNVENPISVFNRVRSPVAHPSYLPIRVKTGVRGFDFYAARTPLDFLMLQLAKLNRAWVLVVLAFVLIVIVLAVIVRVYSGRVRSDPLKKLGPGLYQPTQHQSGEYLPLPPAQTPRR